MQIIALENDRVKPYGYILNYKSTSTHLTTGPCIHYAEWSEWNIGYIQ